MESTYTADKTPQYRTKPRRDPSKWLENPIHTSSGSKETSDIPFFALNYTPGIHLADHALVHGTLSLPDTIRALGWSSTQAATIDFSSHTS